MATAKNAFTSLFSGLQAPSGNISSYLGGFSSQKKPVNQSVAPTQSTGYNMSTPKGPVVASNPIISSNAGATSTAVPKITAAATASPAKQQYVQSLQTGPVDTSSFTSSQKNAYDYATSLIPTAIQTTPPQYTASSGSFSVPTTPKVKTSYETAFDEYLKSLQPSSQEQKAQEALAGLESDIFSKQVAGRRAYDERLDRPGGLVSGAREAASVGSRRSNQELADLAVQQNALANTLGVYAGQRQALTEGQKARLEFEKSLLPSGDGYTLSPGQARYDAQGNLIASAPGTDGFTLSAGQARYDAQGNLIAGGGIGDTSNELLSVSEAQALGVPYGTTKGMAIGRSVSGKPTAEESKARQFAVSAADANKVLETLGYNPGIIESSLVPNVLKGEKRQQFEQASRAFVNATLRRESGATITDDEFLNKYKELIPQAGDGAAVLEQKKLARAAAVQSIKEAGGQTNISSGISPDEETYLRSRGYSPEQINSLRQQSFNSVGGDTNQAANRPQRNNNPLNIKMSVATSTYPGVVGADPVPATDGGKFLVFNSPQAGFEAAKKLIKTEGYANLSVDAALKRWSNKGYGGEIVPALSTKKINQLTPTELDTLIKTMARREGFNA